jgi:sulfate transport system permease protein
LHVEKLYNEYNTAAAFAIASILALLALVTLGIKTLLEWKQAREYEKAQRVVAEPSAALVVAPLPTVPPPTR